MPLWSLRSLISLVLLAALAHSCGSNGSDQNLLACGNGRLDEGEACDDGNTFDGDACTSACRLARCGDGVVQLGVEECDGRAMNGGSCAAVGRAGTLACAAGCQYDYSVCGATFTPTRPPTATPPATTTPTPTPASACGDALLEEGESCATCPADCVAAPCAPSAATAVVGVVASPPAGVSVSSLTVSLAYRTSTVTLPSTNVQSRLRASSGVVVRSMAAATTDYALAVIVGGTIPTGPAFTVTFDRCASAPPPSARDFACTVASCGPASNPVAGCTCAAVVE